MIRYILSILIFLIAIIKMIYPTVFIIPQIDLDRASIILLAISIILLFYKWIFLRPLALVRKIKVKSNTLIKIFIVLLCISIIFLKMIVKDISFDNTSLYLLIIVVVVIILPDIKDFLLRIRKFKKGDFELELGETITQFKEKVEEAEETIEENPAPKADYTKFDDDIVNKLASAANNPRGTLLVIAAEIEQRIRHLASEADIVVGDRHIPSTKLLIELEKREVISRNIYPLFKEFWNIRNKVAHGHSDKIIDSRLYEFAELGVRLLSLLPTSVKKTITYNNFSE